MNLRNRMERVKIKREYKITSKFLGLLLFCCLVFNIPDGNINKVRRLIVNTVWDKNWTFQSFSSFDIDYYQYVRWD